jgi:hypothetical protein
LDRVLIHDTKVYIEKKKKGWFNLSKIKKFCSEKVNIKRIKRQTVDWEKIFASHIPNKGLASRIHKKNTDRWIIQNQPNLKMGKNLNRHFTKENI